MQTFLVEHNVLFALICGVLAVAYGAYLTRWVLQQSPGNERMREIQAAIQEGASAYLNRQYRTVGVVAVVVAALLLVAGIWSDDLGWKVALGFIIGAVLSALAGYVGMNTAVRANARVAEAGRTGLSEAFDVAFKGGTVTGILVVGLGLLGVAGYYGALRLGDVSETSAVHALVGLSFGGSLISVFARLGGGIFTKGADVGADLDGKIEAGIPEDDPRNPAVIADNVGDNVGDDAGMAADLFETYAVTLVAGMLLAQQAGWGAAGLGIPLVLGGISIIASIIGTQFVKVRSGGSVMGALYKGVVITAGISALVFIPVMNWMVDKIPVAHGSWGKLYLCALVGLVITALLMVITEYYTGTKWGPVKRISEASTTGHATNIIAGLAKSMEATAAPVLVIGIGILVAYKLGDITGIALAAVAMLSLAGM
ncbi:MAG: K(+)-stimulated pyrophosphate-energized sodium pump, partial [Solirubrobacteraceae bacterium]|nr:K(+)-stimulated pyrophosphate-energized sodium pump [Solirubrobacteraceae bacterium]